jgi:hypothetical protein
MGRLLMCLHLLFFHLSLLLSISYAIMMKDLLCFYSNPPSLYILIIIFVNHFWKRQHGKMTLIAAHGMVSHVTPSLVTWLVSTLDVKALEVY